jgi:hypothetical protein
MDVVFRDRFLALQRLEIAAQKLACATPRARRPQAAHASARRAPHRNRSRTRFSSVNA